ncbi:MAG TPA: ATP-binding protein [Actinomycetota bacterium]
MDQQPRAGMRSFIAEAAAGAEFPPAVIDDLLLALWEACAQATSHSGNPNVEVTARSDGHTFEMAVRNPGVYRVGAHAPGVQSDERLAVSLAMAIEMSVLDEVHVDTGTEDEPWTRIRLVKLTGR